MNKYRYVCLLLGSLTYSFSALAHFKLPCGHKLGQSIYALHQSTHGFIGKILLERSYRHAVCPMFTQGSLSYSYASDPEYHNWQTNICADTSDLNANPKGYKVAYKYLLSHLKRSVIQDWSTCMAHRHIPQLTQPDQKNATLSCHIMPYTHPHFGQKIHFEVRVNRVISGVRLQLTNAYLDTDTEAYEVPRQLGPGIHVFILNRESSAEDVIVQFKSFLVHRVDDVKSCTKVLSVADFNGERHRPPAQDVCEVQRQSALEQGLINSYDYASLKSGDDVPVKGNHGGFISVGCEHFSAMQGATS